MPGTSFEVTTNKIATVAVIESWVQKSRDEKEKYHMSKNKKLYEAHIMKTTDDRLVAYVPVGVILTGIEKMDGFAKLRSRGVYIQYFGVNKITITCETMLEAKLAELLPQVFENYRFRIDAYLGKVKWTSDEDVPPLATMLQPLVHYFRVPPWHFLKDGGIEVEPKVKEMMERSEGGTAQLMEIMTNAAGFLQNKPVLRDALIAAMSYRFGIAVPKGYESYPEALKRVKETVGEGTAAKEETSGSAPAEARVPKRPEDDEVLPQAENVKTEVKQEVKSEVKTEVKKEPGFVYVNVP